MHWGSKMPFAPTLATAVATRTGIGGVIGQKRTYYSWRFVIDFAGGDLKLLSEDVKVVPVISASRGKIELSSARPLADIQGYRVMFDLIPTDDSAAPIDLRAYMSVDGAPLCETWLYQWSPPAASRRHF
jgi:glucans biosynthesis protein